MPLNSLPIVPQMTNDPLFHYSLQMLNHRPHLFPVDDVLKEMESVALAEEIPIVGALEGALLHMLVTLKRPEVKYVLDIGTAIGYSAIWLARSLGTESHVISIEVDPERAKKAIYFIDKAKLKTKIQIIVGDVFEVLPRIGFRFDVIFQDVIKHLYFAKDSHLAVNLLSLCEARLAEGGILLSDNAYCLGHVLDQPSFEMPNQIVGIQSYKY